jgi:large subunit ribosomal protein L9
MIAKAIKEAKNIELDRKRIHLNEDAIKELGSYKAKIKLHKEVQLDVDFEVFAE